jgi:hypothetical protein
MKTAISVILMSCILSAFSVNYKDEVRRKVDLVGIQSANQFYHDNALNGSGEDIYKYSVFMGDYGYYVKRSAREAVNNELAILNCSATRGFPTAILAASGFLKSIHSVASERARRCLSRQEQTPTSSSNLWTYCAADKVLPQCPAEFQRHSDPSVQF